MSQPAFISRLRSLLTRRVIIEVMQIVAASSAIGFAFNRANPLGVRWHVAKRETAASVLSGNGQLSTKSPLFRNQTIAVELLTAAPTTSTAAELKQESSAPSAATWLDVKPLLGRNGAVLVDARPRNYFDAGHIPGAISVPESSSEGDLAAFRAQHDTSTLLVVYCGSPECPASKRLAETLAEKYGYRNVRYLPGGYQEWQRAELSAASTRK